MKGLFPQYNDRTATDYKAVWENALFVFDTNVLLNLYRYQTTTRDELLTVLGQLSDRIWIPHHVALEFQRNRLKVIAEQGKQFSDVRKTIEKARGSLFADLETLQLHKRHSLINPEPLLMGFKNLIDGFLGELGRLEESQQRLTEPDPLKTKIETLFDGKVGLAPVDQETIDDLYKQAEQRYRQKIPPGYQDNAKDKDDLDGYMHNRLTYKRKYGDFLVWHQLLVHAEVSGSRAIIFVTDDGKEDWWYKIESNGLKTIGPRPELVEEAAVVGHVDSLLMYNPEGFLKFAKEFLEAHVSEQTLKEVRDISTTTSLRNNSFRELRELTWRVEQAVTRWLASRFTTVRENQSSFPGLIAERDGKTYGFDVKLLRHPRMLLNRLRETVYRAYYELNESGFTELVIIWVVNNVEEVAELQYMLQRTSREEMPDNLRMIIGVYNDLDDPETEFIPYEDFAYNEARESSQRAIFSHR